jgi:Uma2 family endonuclease
MAPMKDPHAQAVRLATYALLQVFRPDQATVSVQCPMRLGESRPLPDLVILNGTPRQIITHPTTGLLVIEISDSTLEYDQTDNAALYAANMIPEYWIINLNAQCVDVRRSPFRAKGAAPQDEDLRVYDFQAAIAPLAASHASIKVSDLLP